MVLRYNPQQVSMLILGVISYFELGFISGDLIIGGNTKQGARKDRVTYRDFSACILPQFTWSPYPLVSMRWITDIEGAFRTSRCPDEDKVNFAMDFLQERAKIC